MADPPELPDLSVDADPGTKVVAGEEHELLMAALGDISAQCQQLLRLLLVDPPLSYDEISSMLDMPKGSIGPTRQRCLVRLRAAMATLRGATLRERGIRDTDEGSGGSKEVRQ
jgi:DNA-directed RNA polymerase specialized sigma24 family protein